MKTRLFALAMLFLVTLPAVAAPIVTLGPAVNDAFSTVDPGSIQVEMLGAGETVDIQVSISIHPFCFQPFDIELGTSGDGGTFANLTGPLINNCGGDTNVFTIRLTGDGLPHLYDMEFLDADSASPIAAVTVRIFAGAASSVTLGEPATDSFLTVEPGSIRVDQFEVGDAVAIRLTLTIHPLCFQPIDVILSATGDAGAFSDLTGQLTNNCGGDMSEFNIILTSDGLPHVFEISFTDANFANTYASIPVVLNPGPPPVVTLGPPIDGEFLTVDPGSIRVELLGAGQFVELPITMTIHPLCIRPFDLTLAPSDGSDALNNLTGTVTNNCGGDNSVFNIRLTGDSVPHAFDIEWRDFEFGTLLALTTVELYPGEGDTDLDGVFNLSDNCIEIANIHQRDTDGDEIGNACDQDIAKPNDCRVNFPDLNTLSMAFFSDPRLPTWNPDADFNGDEIVNFQDLERMSEAFFSAPGPSADGCN